MTEKRDNEETELRETAPAFGGTTAGERAIAPSPLDDSLAMTPWERILANDDMVNFGNMLRTAMEKRNAKPR